MSVREDKSASLGHPSLWALTSYFFKLGALGFSGPIALAAHMQKDLVEERRWILKDDYIEGLAFSQLSPGPLAAQLAMYLGWVRGARSLAALCRHRHDHRLAEVGGCLAVPALRDSRHSGEGAATLAPKICLDYIFAQHHGTLHWWARRSLGWDGRQAFLFFLKAGAFVFGSGLAIVPSLRWSGGAIPLAERVAVSGCRGCGDDHTGTRRHYCGFCGLSGGRTNWSELGLVSCVCAALSDCRRRCAVLSPIRPASSGLGFCSRRDGCRGRRHRWRRLYPRSSRTHGSSENTNRRCRPGAVTHCEENSRTATHRSGSSQGFLLSKGH
jgi:hypothetical protein